MMNNVMDVAVQSHFEYKLLFDMHQGKSQKLYVVIWALFEIWLHVITHNVLQKCTFEN